MFFIQISQTIYLLNFGVIFLKPWSNELDFLQYNMQHLSSGKSCDRLTTLFIHVATCCMLSKEVWSGSKMLHRQMLCIYNTFLLFLKFAPSLEQMSRQNVQCVWPRKDPTTCNNVQPNVRQMLPVVFEKSSSFDQGLTALGVILHFQTVFWGSNAKWVQV